MAGSKGVPDQRNRHARDRERTVGSLQIELGSGVLAVPLDPSLDNSRDRQGCRYHGLEFARRLTDEVIE
jgi:hypothetical protein